MDEKKPKLNNARMYTTGSYRGVYDVKCVDEERKIWKGRPIVDARIAEMPQMKGQVDTGWVFFSREYDDRNDWDRLYHEIEFEDESILGQKFLLIPKEKMLFGYDPPTEGIILPHPAVRIRR
jgi:hypothetical protein